jgi:hypothetical protein
VEAPRRPPSKVTPDLYARAWEAYRADPTAQAVARACALHRRTAEKLVKDGYPRVGYAPLAERLRAENENVRTLTLYPRAVARAEAASALREVRALYRDLIAKVRANLERVHVDLDAASLVGATRALAATARDLSAVERELFGDDAGDEGQRVIVVRDLGSDAAEVIPIGARAIHSDATAKGGMSRPAVGTRPVIDAAAIADGDSPDAAALAPRRGV